MTVFYMRHGHTNYNELGLCNDNPSRDVHLTDKGKAQAQQAALQLKDKRIDIMLVSQLPRTLQTAQIVNQFHNVGILQHGEINDIRSGFDGRPVRDYFAAIASDRLNTIPDGGESLLQHKQRIVTFLQQLHAQGADHYLMVCHEETLRVINAFYRGLNNTQMLDHHFDNCQIIAFEPLT